MLKRILAFFNRLVVALFVHPQDRQITVDAKEVNLMTQVDTRRLSEMEKILAVLTVNVHRLVEEEKKTQEYMVHLSTLHEELLNQLDQGNIAMVRVRRNDGTGTDDDDIEAMMRNEVEGPVKKTDLN